MDGFFLLARNRDASVVLEARRLLHRAGDRGHRARASSASPGRSRWKAGTKSYKLGADLLVGERSDPSGEFDYFMIQAYFRATIGPLGAWEFTGARFLFARNMVPKLSALDLQSRDLRYYRWYKEQNNPLTIPGDRRLASWRPEPDAWALGFGASGSLPAFGKVVEVSAFLSLSEAGARRG